MSSHHRKTYKKIFNIKNGSARASVLLLISAFIFLPVAPVFASEDLNAPTDSEQKESSAVVNGVAHEIQLDSESVDSNADNKASTVLEPDQSLSKTTTTSVRNDLEETVKDVEKDETEEVKKFNSEHQQGTKSNKQQATTTDIESPSGTVATSTSLEEKSSPTKKSATSTVSGIATTTEQTTKAATSTDVPEKNRVLNATSTSSGTTTETEVQGTKNSDTEIATSTSDATSTDNKQKLEAEQLHEEGVLATTSFDVVEEVEKTQHASTTSNVTPLQSSVSSVTNNQNRHQFADGECVTVGDGFYYCSKTTENKNTPYQKNDLFAASDADGDTEIYVIRDGVQSKISDNIYDDLAPYYDPVSKRIVWHRLINDRYQIISYDVNSGEETQLTETAFNNMEPSAFGDVTVWQAWVDGNWEIMVDQKNDTQRLTKNSVHDVAPFINKEYIVWQTEAGQGWYTSVYDRNTQVIEQIKNEDNAAVKNPRFVLVYDTYLDNGDVQTLGYDLKSKKVVPLSAVPVNLPKEIPEPDPTEEKRALIQNKPPGKEEIAEAPDQDSGDDDPPDTKGATTTKSGTASTSPMVEEGTVVIPTNDMISTTTLRETRSSSSPGIIPDVVVESQGAHNVSSTTKDVSHVEDLVIPQSSVKEIE